MRHPNASWCSKQKAKTTIYLCKKEQNNQTQFIVLSLSVSQEAQKTHTVLANSYNDCYSRWTLQEINWRYFVRGLEVSGRWQMQRLLCPFRNAGWCLFVGERDAEWILVNGAGWETKSVSCCCWLWQGLFLGVWVQHLQGSGVCCW